MKRFSIFIFLSLQIVVTSVSAQTYYRITQEGLNEAEKELRKGNVVAADKALTSRHFADDTIGPKDFQKFYQFMMLFDCMGQYIDRLFEHRTFWNQISIGEIVGWKEDLHSFIGIADKMPRTASTVRVRSCLLLVRAFIWEQLPLQKKRAEKTYQTSMAKDSLNPVPKLLFAMFLSSKYRIDEALPLIENALVLAPNNSEFFVLSAQYFWQAGQETRALKLARKGYRLSPTYVLGVYGLADLLCGSNRGKEGLQLIDDFLKVRGLHDYAHVQAQCLMTMGRHKEALDILNMIPKKIAFQLLRYKLLKPIALSFTGSTAEATRLARRIHDGYIKGKKRTFLRRYFFFTKPLVQKYFELVAKN